jgi:DNA polymerase I
MGLMGDAVDNIPGVKGIGEKTAIGLIRRFGTLENLFSRLDEIEHLELCGAARLRRMLEDGREAAFLSRDLASVSRNAPINISLEPLKFTGFDEEKLHCLFAELEFNILVNCWKMGGFDSIPRRACAR